MWGSLRLAPIKVSGGTVFGHFTHTHTHTRKTHTHTHTHRRGHNAHGMHTQSNGVVIQVGGGYGVWPFHTHTHVQPHIDHMCCRFSH